MKVVHRSCLIELPKRECECGKKMPFKALMCEDCKKKLLKKKLLCESCEAKQSILLKSKNGKSKKKELDHVI